MFPDWNFPDGRYASNVVTLKMIEFPTSDAEASAEFFAAAFGLTAIPYGPQYTDVPLGGLQSLGFQGDQREAPSGPLVVLQTDDLDRERLEIEAAGGVITVEPFDFPGGRRFHFREPGGSELAVYVPRE